MRFSEALSWWRAVRSLGVAIRLMAACIWLVAGAAKIADLQHFHAQVIQYRLLPHALEAPFAYTLPFVEVLVGMYLAVGLLTRAAAAVSCVLMVMFLVAQAQAWARGLSLDCGCFGAISHETVGLGTILRDVALGIPSLVMLWRPARAFSLDERLLGLPDPFSTSFGAQSGDGAAGLGRLFRRRVGLGGRAAGAAAGDARPPQR
jgi:uncharacterized membrane protein YphA (DoxX/SURF4 family)